MTVSKGSSVMIACRLAVIVVASAALSPATGGAADRDDRAIADATTATLPELVEFLRLPNIVNGPADDIGRNADWLEATFRRHGLDARQLEADGTRWVFAETPAASNAKRTIIFYAHMDGQAVVAVNWTQPDPFVPVLKQTTDGGDRVPIDLKRLFGPNPDPEWRLFARSAADDKAPILMLIAAIAYPTLNVTGITAGETGSGRSIIPAFATAEFDIRPVPGTPIERQFALVRAWIQRQGYHLVERDAPTEEERARWPRLAAMHVAGGFPAVMTPRDTPLARWVRAALRAAQGQEPVHIPLMGGAVPSASFVRGLDAPVIILPLVNADNNQHAADENLRIGNYFAGVKSLFCLLTQPFPDT